LVSSRHAARQPPIMSPEGAKLFNPKGFGTGFYDRPFVPAVARYE
jgi:hypothetical protein